MGKREKRIDAYIDAAQDFAKPIIAHLRDLIHEACPEVEETWKWSFPNFMYKGAILCSMAAFKNHCSFSFWKATLIQDTDQILTLTERAAMGHLGKILSLNDLPDDEILLKYIKAAMKLNEENIKLPPRTKTPEAKTQDLVIPDFLVTELEKNMDAKTVFNNFSYSHKKEYIDWITEAKTEPTRLKRVRQAVEMIAEGKGRNWKYEK